MPVPAGPQARRRRRKQSKDVEKAATRQTLSSGEPSAFLRNPKRGRTRRTSASTCSLPEATAWQTRWHMEQTRLAVAELSMPPLRGRKKPPWRKDGRGQKQRWAGAALRRVRATHLVDAGSFQMQGRARTSPERRK